MIRMHFPICVFFHMFHSSIILRKMADNAFDWAAKNNFLRMNEIHGEQEAKLILEDGFSYEQTEKEETLQTARMEVEDSR